MSALTSDRNTPMAIGDMRSFAVAADQVIFAGALVMRNSAGFLVKGQTATGLVGVGRAEEAIDTTGDSNGDKSLTCRAGIFRFANDGSDPVDLSDIGKPCFAVDDQTVAQTDGTSTRSIAGVVDKIDTTGVWVRFDEALMHATA